MLPLLRLTEASRCPAGCQLYKGLSASAVPLESKSLRQEYLIMYLMPKQGSPLLDSRALYYTAEGQPTHMWLEELVYIVSFVLYSRLMVFIAERLPKD